MTSDLFCQVWFFVFTWYIYNIHVFLKLYATKYEFPGSKIAHLTKYETLIQSNLFYIKYWICPWASIILWDLPWAPTPCCLDTCQESQDLPTCCLLVLKGQPVNWNQYTCIRFYFIWSFIRSIFFFTSDLLPWNTHGYLFIICM